MQEAGQAFADGVHRLIAHLRTQPGAESDRRSWVLALSVLLAELYAAGLRLPALEPAEGTATGARALFQPVRLELGVPRAYFRHADLRKAGSEEVGDLEEDFEDLLGELTRGLSSWEDGTPAGRIYAQVHWRRTLPHWGHHAVEALRALHYWVYGQPG